MSRSGFSFLRVVGPLAAAGALAMGTLPAFAQPTTPSSAANCSDVRFELSNPAPGAMLEPGGLVLEGVAIDERATESEGAGIDRVDFFLGNRDEGGTNIGTAEPSAVTGPFGAGSFRTTVQLPSTPGSHDLFAYAHSSVTNQEIVLSEPISVGLSRAVAAPTSANASTPTLTESCTAQSSMTSAEEVPAVSESTTEMTPTPMEPIETVDTHCCRPEGD